MLSIQRGSYVRIEIQTIKVESHPSTTWIDIPTGRS